MTYFAWQINLIQPLLCIWYIFCTPFCKSPPFLPPLLYCLAFNAAAEPRKPEAVICFLNNKWSLLRFDLKYSKAILDLRLQLCTELQRAQEPPPAKEWGGNWVGRRIPYMCAVLGASPQTIYHSSGKWKKCGFPPLLVRVRSGLPPVGCLLVIVSAQTMHRPEKTFPLDWSRNNPSPNL